MKHPITLVVTTVIVAAVAAIPSLEFVNRDTAIRIAEHKYPVETHTVHTADGYILSLFRIPYSPILQNQNVHRPATLVHHGFLSSSDGWIVSGPDNSLPYLLADAGYDVWLSNARGSTYSKEHETLSSSESTYWNFSWHEIGLYDISALIDYILHSTNQTELHYVAHSMGTTAFLVLMSLRPEYNAKIKTAHLLAPVAFTSHVTNIIQTVAGPLIGHPSILSDLLENTEFLPRKTLNNWAGSIACLQASPIQPVCSFILLALFGYSTHMNTTALSEFFETHPAGTSSNTYLHFSQQYVSGHFRWYDHGRGGNLQRYSQPSPPDYDVSKIVAPVWLYYSDSDTLSNVTDVRRLKSLLPNVAHSFHVPYFQWNHLDFLFALEVRKVIFDRVISAVDNFEATGNQ